MTIQDLHEMTDDFITPATAAAVMKMDVGKLIWYARSGQLPFPVIVSGNRVKIVRQGLIDFLEGRKPEQQKAAAHTELDRIAEKLAEMAKNIELLTAIGMAMLTVTAPEIAERLMDKEEGSLQ